MKALEIEGELEEDPPFLPPVDPNPADSTPAQGPLIGPIETIEQMLRETQRFYEKELISGLNSCENLSKEQIKSFDLLEKFQAQFYSKEMIEIQETFGLIPQYLKKISEIREKIREAERKYAAIQAKNKKINEKK